MIRTIMRFGVIVIVVVALAATIKAAMDWDAKRHKMIYDAWERAQKAEIAPCCSSCECGRRGK